MPDNHKNFHCRKSLYLPFSTEAGWDNGFTEIARSWALDQDSLETGREHTDGERKQTFCEQVIGCSFASLDLLHLNCEKDQTIPNT